MQAIKATGDFFTNDDGTEHHYVGLSEFGLWKRFNMTDGPEALVRPLLIERRSLADKANYNGPIVLRVFRYAHPGNPFGVLPGQTDYKKIGNFLDLLALYGFYVDMTTGDSQLVLPSVSDQQSDLNKYTTELNIAGRFSFVETCNEPFKNGELPQNGVKPSSSPHYLRDSGNYVFINNSTTWPTEYDLDFISFHGDRTNDPPRWPKWVCDLDDSLSVLRSVVKKPSVLKETNKFGAYYNDPSLARILGLRANMGGVVFHSQLGLESNGYDDATKEACYQFFRGVQGSLA
jgi:hypothetical protein